MDRKQPVTLLDVARAAGVSRATASLVVRGSPAVATTTRERVEAAMLDLGYVYNRGAAGLRAGRSDVVGLVLPNIANPFFAEFLEGFEAVLIAAGRSVFLAASHEDAAAERTVLQRMGEHGCDGLVICPSPGLTADDLRDLDRFDKPVVQCLRRVSDAHDYVGPDYARGMEEVIAHLHDLGHRRIAFVGSATRTTALTERMDGLVAGLRRRGLPEAWMIGLDAPARAGDVAAAAAEGVTAAICFSDMTAMRLSGPLQDLGIEAGRDLSLSGFDGIRFVEMFRPRLTTVRTFPDRLGRAAAGQLMARLAEPALPVALHRLEVEFVAGASTGRPRSQG